MTRFALGARCMHSLRPGDGSVSRMECHHALHPSTTRWSRGVSRQSGFVWFVEQVVIGTANHG
jgi:hypothetical protein